MGYRSNNTPSPHDTHPANDVLPAYLDFPVPSGQQKGTAVLIHGFPDCSLAWRYQIPLLTGLGLRCIALDCMGYGDTGTSSDLRDFGFKAHADAVEALCQKLGAASIVLGGHDWGGAAVYRIAQWKPRLVSHVFSVCTPYFKVMDQFVSTQDLIDAGVKQFGYQLQWGSEDGKVEAVVKDERTIRNFLLGAYGGKPKSGRQFMDPQVGVDLDVVKEDEFGMSPLLNQEVSYALSLFREHLCAVEADPMAGDRLLRRRVHEKRHPRAVQLVPHAQSQLRGREVPTLRAALGRRAAGALRLRHRRQHPERGPAARHGEVGAESDPGQRAGQPLGAVAHAGANERFDQEVARGRRVWEGEQVVIVMTVPER